MKKDYESLKIYFEELSGVDIMNVSLEEDLLTNDNDGQDVPNWEMD